MLAGLTSLVGAAGGLFGGGGGSDAPAGPISQRTGGNVITFPARPDRDREPINYTVPILLAGGAVLLATAFFVLRKK